MIRMVYRMNITSDIRVNEQGIMNKINSKGRRIGQIAEKIMITELRKAAPVSKGRLRNSIKTIVVDSRTDQRGFSSKIVVGPTARHAKYVIRKTRASQGAYVRVIKKRIKFGEHPGTKSNNFIIESRGIIAQKIQRAVTNEFGVSNLSLARFFKG